MVQRCLWSHTILVLSVTKRLGRRAYTDYWSPNASMESNYKVKKNIWKEKPVISSLYILGNCLILLTFWETWDPFVCQISKGFVYSLEDQTSQQMFLLNACRWGYGVMDVSLEKQVYIETWVEIVCYSCPLSILFHCCYDWIG